MWERSLLVNDFLLGAPKTQLYQILANAIGATVLAANKIEKNNKKDISAIKPNNINSQLNFKVPGIAKYIRTIKIIDIPKLGEVCIIPTTSAVCRDWKRLCIQSTKKNIREDNRACIKQKITPTLTIGE